MESRYPTSSSMPSSSGSNNTYEQASTSTQEESNFEADIHNINGGWELVGEKTGGANSAGKLGGVYIEIKNPDRKVLFKQDPIIAKNICEFIAGKLMRAIMPDADGLFAKVELAFENEKSMPNETGKNVYLGSEFYSGYTDLYKDAYHAYNNLSMFHLLRENNGGKRPCPETRPKYLAFVNLHFKRLIDPVIASVIERGRYPNFVKLLVASIFVDDPDVHTANIGVIPTKEIAERIGNEEVIYQVEAVRIDFGGAFADKKRKLDGKLHYNETFRYLSLTKEGPPNYLQTYPKEIYKGDDFYKELLKLSCFPPDILIAELKNILGEVACYYGREPLISFAKFIGIEEFLRKTDENDIVSLLEHYEVSFLIQEKDKRVKKIDNLDKEAVLALITIFMGSSLIQRLSAAEEAAKRVSRCLNVTDEEFENNKLSSARTVRQLLGLQVENLDAELEKSEHLIYKYNEMIKEMLLPLHEEVGKIIVIALKPINTHQLYISADEVVRVTEKYTTQSMQALLKAHFDMEQIFYCIKNNPSQMDKLYQQFEDASKMFMQARNNESKNAALSLLKFSEQRSKLLIENEPGKEKEKEKEEVLEPDALMGNEKVKHLFILIINALNDYLPHNKKRLFGLFSSKNSYNNEARLALSLLIADGVKVPDKLEIICALFSLKNSAPGLRDFLMTRVKETVIDHEFNVNLLTFNNAIYLFIKKEYGYDVNTLKSQISKYSLRDFLEYKKLHLPSKKNVKLK